VRKCDKLVIALFGALFLVALFAVPVTRTTSRLRQDPGSNIVTRTVYPQKATMFLPQYLLLRAHPRQGRPVPLRGGQWAVTMAIVAILGVFDYFVFCRLLRRPRRPADREDPSLSLLC